MKGNEARVVFFLHPVDRLKDGQVSKVKNTQGSSFGVLALLLLFFLLLGLGLGLLLYLFLPFVLQPRQQGLVQVTERITEITSNKNEEDFITVETEAPKGTNQTGKMSFFFSIPNEV